MSMGVGYLRTSVRCLTISSVIVALCSFLQPSAHADGLIPLGGGSGIVVEGDTFCTLTAIGNDNRGNLIGFTSAHCGGPGAQVGAEGAEGNGVLADDELCEGLRLEREVGGAEICPVREQRLVDVEDDRVIPRGVAAQVMVERAHRGPGGVCERAVVGARVVPGDALPLEQREVRAGLAGRAAREGEREKEGREALHARQNAAEADARRGGSSRRRAIRIVRMGDVRYRA